MIVTDINMPEMDGIELVKEIRKPSAFKHVPVLVLTTDNTDEKKRSGGRRSDRLVGETVRLGPDPEGHTKGAAIVNGDYSKFLQTFLRKSRNTYPCWNPASSPSSRIPMMSKS